VQPGELKRFETFMLPHLDAAYTLARHLIRDPIDAQDVVQDAYLRALKYFGGFHGTDVGEGRGWLLAIVRNTAYSWHRRRRPEANATEFDESLHSGGVADSHPEAAMLGRARRESLTREIDRLAPEYRETIVLREIQGFSYKEIADITGVPVGTVMSRLSRARHRLQQALHAERDEE
jgi:RNA polymerase sigma-70 factor (ECF subfamily)